MEGKLFEDLSARKTEELNKFKKINTLLNFWFQVPLCLWQSSISVRSDS